jgi:hypothetical protein
MVPPFFLGRKSMPLPALIAAAVAAIGTYIVVPKLAEEVEKKVGKLAAQEVLDRMGIPLDLDGEVNQITITQAINAGVLGGDIEFTNLFDRDAVRADVRRIAIAGAGEAFGYEGGLGIQELKERLIASVIDDVRAQIAAGEGDYIDAAKGLVSAHEAISRPVNTTASTPIDMSEKGVKNRAKQARYRAAHKRVWVQR